MIAGTTQSGKGVALSVLISQAVYRGDVVIILDPKNSKRLKRAVVGACADAREPDTFLEFHPAFPERGVRLDPMFNWQKPTELASRIQSIMPPDTAGAFSALAGTPSTSSSRFGRTGGSSKPDEACPVHRGRHRARPGGLVAALLRRDARH